MVKKHVILEPEDCGEKCEQVRGLFKKEEEGGTVFFLKIGTPEGDKVAEALGLTDIKEPKALVIADIADVIEIKEVELEPEKEDKKKQI